MQWTVLESVYFILVATTTVGYGDFTPTTEGARVFTFFFLMAGLALFTLLLVCLSVTLISAHCL